MITKQQRPLQVNTIHRPLSSLSCARVVRLAFLFLRSLAPNLIRVQNIVHYVGCHPTKGHDVNLTLSIYFASKHFGDSACFGLQNLRDSAPIKLHFYDILYWHKWHKWHKLSFKTRFSAISATSATSFF